MRIVRTDFQRKNYLKAAEIQRYAYGLSTTQVIKYDRLSYEICAKGEIQDRPLQLYDLLEYGWAHTTPISLKWHLEQHKDDVIEAITKYCNTTCWGFVNGVLEMFESYRLAMDNDAISQHLAL